MVSRISVIIGVVVLYILAGLLINWANKKIMARGKDSTYFEYLLIVALDFLYVGGIFVFLIHIIDEVF